MSQINMSDYPISCITQNKVRFWVVDIKEINGCL